MSGSRRTPWFPSQLKPVHAGKYETRVDLSVGIVTAYWSGTLWRWAESGGQCVFQDREWRGVRSPKGEEPPAGIHLRRRSGPVSPDTVMPFG